MTPEQSRQLYNLDRLNTALLVDADEVTQLDAGGGTMVKYPLMVVQRQKQILDLLKTGSGNPDTAAILAAIDEVPGKTADELHADPERDGTGT